MALHFDITEYEARREKLLAEMTARKLDAVLLFAQESMYWLTGYDTFGYCFFQSLVLTKSGEMVLLTRSADLRQAQHTSTIANIKIWTDRADANPALELRRLLADLDLLGTRIGVEYATHGLTAANGRLLDEQLATFCNVIDISGLVDGLRLVKSDAEIERTVMAAKLADDALDAALAITKAKADEGDILAAMQGAIFAGGGDYPANEFIIGSAEDALLCRYKAGRRKLSKNDQLTLEWAGAYHHYHAAMMRTIIIGKPTKRHEHLFEACAAALAACEGEMQVGRTFGDVYEAHARALDVMDLARHRLNACGYSLGARFSPSWMERQMFYANNPEVIGPNMVLFAHMIIMDSESQTAMTLGQTYVTTVDGPRRLSRHAPSLITR
ncbi:MAG: Xaa-Pro peptidase family protein [Rhizobiaceae bacterium]|nr:Xaa-Pro peptidase family protein [Rhizobiaceae bacterium]